MNKFGVQLVTTMQNYSNDRNSCITVTAPRYVASTTVQYYYLIPLKVYFISNSFFPANEIKSDNTRYSELETRTKNTLKNYRAQNLFFCEFLLYFLSEFRVACVAVQNNHTAQNQTTVYIDLYHSI